MTYADLMTTTYLKQLLRSPKGRSHFLAQVADAEGSGEGKVFERLAERKDDPELQRLVARHAADEQRHSELLGARADATGLPRPAIPESIKLLNRLDEALGSPFSKPIETREDVMKTYLLLQVIEERAVTQFAVFKKALAEVDPESAATFDGIEKDEERHLKYCHAIARRYAPNPEVHARTLEHYREVEAKVFAQNSNRNLFHALREGLLDVSAPVRAAWWLTGIVVRWLDPSRPTPFAKEPVEQVEQVEVAAVAAA